MRVVRGAALRAVAGGDAGVTLAELVVSMTIMAIFMSMFTAVAIRMFHFETTTETTTSDLAQVHIALLRLDKDIRYAAGISQPDASYVEYLRTDQGVSTCTELWLDTAQRALKSRTWLQGATPQSNWTTLASDATAAPPRPFDLQPLSAPVTSQRLQINLLVKPVDSSVTPRTLTMLFTALNTSSATASGTVCVEGRLVP